MDLGEIGWGVVDWICLAQDRDKWRAFVKVIMILRVAYNADNGGKFLSGCTIVGLSNMAQLYRLS
jgi:hypothetical protein